MQRAEMRAERERAGERANVKRHSVLWRAACVEEESITNEDDCEEGESEEEEEGEEEGEEEEVVGAVVAVAEGEEGGGDCAVCVRVCEEVSDNSDALPPGCSCTISDGGESELK